MIEKRKAGGRNLNDLAALKSSIVTNPRSFASSQTGSLGQEVRQASITSS
jgi:hypothetical protein